MRVQKELLINIFLRWAIIHAIALVIILAWDIGLWKFVLVMLAVNALAVYIVYDYLRRHQSVSIEMKEHALSPTLRIADQTLPYLRRGLNEETAAKIVEIIQKLTGVAAVAVTDQEKVLAYIGVGSDHHKAGGPILTFATREVLATGELKVVESRYGLNCPNKDCLLESAVIAPLKCKGKVVGTVKLYQTMEGEIPSQVVNLTVGVAQLLGIQMELAEFAHQDQLVTKAELDALQAQINPHFLFNTLNTIIMFSRTNPETARRLLIRLATFFRHALKRHGHYNTLKEEIEYLNTYLILEKARFRDKLKVVRDIDESLLDYQVPVLTIQPLVENAIKHGILPKTGPGTVHITVSPGEDEMLIVIRDDGVGIPRGKIPEVLKPGCGSGNGVGLSNVHERMKGLFGEEYGLRIVSVPGEGTSIYVRVPLMIDSQTREVMAQ